MNSASRDRSTERVVLAIALVLLALTGGCALLVPEVRFELTSALAPDADSGLGRLSRAEAARHPGMSGFKVLESGRAAFVTRAELADAAELALDLQYYSAADDLSGALLLQRIGAAAQRGVRVRILLDDIHPSSRLFGRRAMALHPNIRVRLFNPFVFGGVSSVGRTLECAFDGPRLNRRMHNKLWLTDNAVAIVGSRNLGNEYFGAHDSANFTDAELLAVGPIVGELSAAFDAFWNTAAAIPFEAVDPASERLEEARVRENLQARERACGMEALCKWLSEPGPLTRWRAGAAALTWGLARAYWHPPDGGGSREASNEAGRSPEDHPGGERTIAELLIASPYFIPSEEGLLHFGEMRERGVRVAVLTNSLASTDSPAAHAGYARHRVALLQNGIELYETRPEPGVPHKRSHRWGQASPVSLHAKFVVQDRARVIVGSHNQDPRSRLHNTELWIAVESADLAVDLATLFDEGSALEHSYQVRLATELGAKDLVWMTDQDGVITHLRDEPATSPWLQWWRNALGAVIPEHLL